MSDNIQSEKKLREHFTAKKRSDPDPRLDTPVKTKKERTLPCGREDGQQAIEILNYEEEPTEVDEPLEKYEDKVQTPLSVTTADDRRHVRRTLPWKREDAQEVIEVLSDDEEPTEEDESVEISEDEDKVRTPVRVITVDDMRHVRRITAKQRQKPQQPPPAKSINSTMSSSMESCYFSCPPTPLRRKKPVSKMQMKCEYDENRWREWNSLRVYIHLFSVIYTYTNGCRILSEIY